MKFNAIFLPENFHQNHLILPKQLVRNQQGFSILNFGDVRSQNQVWEFFQQVWGIFQVQYVKLHEMPRNFPPGKISPKPLYPAQAAR